VRRFGLIITIGGLLVGLFALPADATAASYEVHACRLPSGTAAPAHGWTTTTAFGPGAISKIDCPGGAMTSRPANGEHNIGYLLGFSFTAPANTAIVGYNRHAEGLVNTVWGGPPPWRWQYGEFGTVVGSDEPVDIAGCDNCGAFTFTWDYPKLGFRLSRIFSALRCGGPATCTANGSYFVLRSIALRLEDLKAPQVLGASGSLLDNSLPQRGERFLSLKLRDIGGGLLKSRVEVDGQRLAEQAIDDNLGRCKTPFVAPVPCKLSAELELPIDTTRLADGRHQITVRVFDATGVNSTLYGPVPIDVDNIADPAPSTLTCPAGVAGTLTRHLGSRTTRYGALASMSGRIAGGISYRGSRVTLVDRAGARATAKAVGVHRGGRFHLRVRLRKSQVVRPMLLTASGVPQLCGGAVRLRVRAGLKFTVAPKRLANGQSIRMNGRFLGLPLPSAGKAVVIQARARGTSSWTTVSTLRVGPSGQFAFRYRFRRTFQRTTYEFRALSPRQGDYPYARGWSRVRRAVVTP
jgi:hypothetical protein